MDSPARIYPPIEKLNQGGYFRAKCKIFPPAPVLHNCQGMCISYAWLVNGATAESYLTHLDFSPPVKVPCRGILIDDEDCQR